MVFLEDLHEIVILINLFGYLLVELLPHQIDEVVVSIVCTERLVHLWINQDRLPNLLKDLVILV